MSLPSPQPGLVIRYSYLWQLEALEGHEEGAKDRPCAIVVAVRDQSQQTRIYALPITHTPPSLPSLGIEIPRPVKVRLNLDSDRSWIIVSEANAFTWPGPDLRPAPGQGLETVAYGFLPPGFFKVVRDRYLAYDAERRGRVIARTE
jgi:hypothetical protein